MGVTLLGARPLLIELGVGAAPRLLLLIVLGALVYLPLVLWRTPEALSDVRSLLGRGQQATAAPPVPVSPAPVAA